MLIEKAFDTGAVKLNYAEGPPSGPPVVLIHGFTDNWQMFSLLLPFLLPRWQIFAPDLRGHGRSGRASSYTWDDFSEDVATFLDGVVGQPAAVIGSSLGGLVSIRVTARRPQGVRALVVGDSPLYRGTMGELWKKWTSPEVVEQRDKLKELIRTGKPVAALAQELALRYPQRDAGWMRYISRSCAQVDPGVFAVFDSGNPDYLLAQAELTERLLSQITCPTLLLASEMLTPEDGQRALAQLPEGYLVRFEGMGHLLHQEKEGYQVIAAITHFLESLG